MNTIVDDLRHSYDALPYPGAAMRLTHPDNLSAVAAVSGVMTAPVQSCRVLEIGCGEGRNLLPMAMTLPGSRFLGIDLSAQQVDAARATAERLGLVNLELRSQNLLEFPASEGAFDFIIAHGIYSWIPPEVREGMMALIARHLAPQGVAYVSYNTYPGWHLRRVGRDLMLFHARRAQGHVQRLELARQIMALAAQAPQGYSNYHDVVARANDDLSDASDWYLFHEFLERVNHPVYFEQFVQHAAAHRLVHLGDARPSLIAWQWLPAGLREQVIGFTQNQIEREQYMDFLCGRAFRSSILCRPDAARSPGGAGALAGMFVAGAFTESAGDEGAVIFTARQQHVAIPGSDADSIAAFRRIGRAWPHAVAIAQLTSDIAGTTVAQQVINGYLSEVLELWTRPTHFIAAECERPAATALAQHQAAAGGAEQVVNLRHENLPATLLLQHVLPLLDGTRTRADLLGELARLVESRTIALPQNAAASQRDDLRAQLDLILRGFANHSLLTQHPF